MNLKFRLSPIKIVYLLASLLIFLDGVCAQVPVGGLRGQVTDPSGAAVAGATAESQADHTPLPAPIESTHVIATRVESAEMSRGLYGRAGKTPTSKCSMAAAARQPVN